MISRAITPRRQGRRAITMLAAAGLVAGTIITSGVVFATAPEADPPGFFELDKNPTNDLTVSHLGSLKSQVSNATTDTITVCERTPTLPFDPPLPPASGDIILIDAEQMEITNVSAASNKTGGCGFTDPADTVADVRVYTVDRHANDTTATSHPGGADVSLLIPATDKPGVDWDQVWSEYEAHTTTPPPIVSPYDKNPCADITDSVACVFLSDPEGLSAFTQGSSDTLDIPDWHWTDMGVPDADEILHAYAIKFSNSSQFLYFGADRYAVNGAKDMGFWFFRNPVFADPATGEFVDDEGNPAEHAIGDILLLGTFTQGGSVTTIRVYEWVGGGGSDGSLDQAGNFGDCVPGGGSDGCDTVNSTTVESPWAYQGKGSTAAADVIYGGGFMEGGVDLGALGLSGCFSSFMAETRSSPSLTAAQKDFTLGRFEACSSDLTTTPADGSGTALTDSDSMGDPGYGLPDTQIGTGTTGVDVTDNAALNVGGIATWSGMLKFYICGPIASGTCDSGGYLADTQSVDQSTSQPITSASVNLTSVGRYCWRGEFTSATEGVPDGTDATDGECFEVKPVTPTLATASVAAAEGLSPTIYSGLADVNGDGVVDANDDANAFYGDTSIINGGLDCNNWTADNDGAAGDGAIDGNDDCTLIGYDGTNDGVTIEVVDGQFATADGDPIADGTPLPTVFNAGTPDDPSVADADFAWSTLFGKVDSNGNGSIDDDDCSVGVVSGADILGQTCAFGPPEPPTALNGLVDLDNDHDITSADTCTDGCFLGHDVSNGFVVAGPVDFGQPLYDVATLDGTAYQPGDDGSNTTYPSIEATMDTAADSSITFKLVGPGDCETTATKLDATPGTNPETGVLVSGDGYYYSSGFTPGEPGAYHWQATYLGDSADTNGNGPNTLGTSHNDGNDGQAACSWTAEDVTVRTIPTMIQTQQSWFPNDKANITSTVDGDLLGAGGTVDFYLYDSDGCDTGTILYEEQQTLTGNSHSEEVFTHNYTGSSAVKTDGSTTVTPYSVTTAYDDAASSDVTLYWKVVYTPASGDTAHTGIQSSCTETHTINYTNDNGPGTDLTP